MKLLLAIFFVLAVNIFAQRLEYSSLSDTVPVSGITHAMADSIFRYIASQEDVIEFEDCNICKSRAHISARAIEKHFAGIAPGGVTVGKAWLFADCKRLSQRDKYRYKPQVYLEHKGVCSKWGYHVAPVIITPGDTFVIDPATQSKAVSLKDWALSLIPNSGEGFALIKHADYFIYPDNKDNLFEDEKLVWYDEGETLTDESFSRSIDEVTRTAMGLIEPWRMRERVKKVKKLIGID